MSISPRENFFMPPPVPDTPTVTFTSGASARYSSATASVTGYTVEEPSIEIEPDISLPPSSVLPPHDVKANEAPTRMAALSLNR
ncbi:hypothetical protein D9M68_875760 [compost metagenome]